MSQQNETEYENNSHAPTYNHRHCQPAARQPWGLLTPPAPVYDRAYSWAALGMDLDKYLFFD